MKVKDTEKLYTSIRKNKKCQVNTPKCKSTPLDDNVRSWLQMMCMGKYQKILVSSPPVSEELTMSRLHYWGWSSVRELRFF